MILLNELTENTDSLKNVLRMGVPGISLEISKHFDISHLGLPSYALREKGIENSKLIKKSKGIELNGDTFNELEVEGISIYHFDNQYYKITFTCSYAEVFQSYVQSAKIYQYPSHFDFLIDMKDLVYQNNESVEHINNRTKDGTILGMIPYFPKEALDVRDPEMFESIIFGKPYLLVKTLDKYKAFFD